MPEDMQQERSSGKSVGIDVAKYQAMIDEPGLSDEDKQAFIEALWQIIVAFVDLGFGVHPVQQVCGQVGETARPEPEDRSDVLECADQAHEHFERTVQRTGKDGSDEGSI